MVHRPAGKSHQQRALISRFVGRWPRVLEPHGPKRAFGHARSALCTLSGAHCSRARKVFARPANSCQHLSAARLPLPGLKPLCAPKTRDVIPLADRVAFVELNRGKRAAIAPPACGGSLQVRRPTLAGLARGEENGRPDFSLCKLKP